MAFNTENLTTDYKKLLSMPISTRSSLAKNGILDSVLSMMTPTQLAALFPSYYKESLPSISGFQTAITKTTSAAGGGTGGGGSAMFVTPSQQQAASNAGLGNVLPNQGKADAVKYQSTESATEVQKGIISIANRFGMNPVDVATFMRYETGGTLDPLQPGPTTQWGQHRGLIQMGEVQQKEYGINLDPKKGPTSSIEEQFAAIEKYFVANGFDKWLTDNPNATVHQKRLAMYATVNAGSPYKVNATDQYNGGAPGTVVDKVNEMYSDKKGSHYSRATEFMETSYAATQPTPSTLNQPTQGQAVPAGGSDVFPADQQTMTGKSSSAPKFSISKGHIEEVDPRLQDVIKAASNDLPEGYTVKAISGKDVRTTGTKNHPAGLAMDVQIYDSEGKLVPHNSNSPGWKYYEMLYRSAHIRGQEMYPDQKFIWGGAWISDAAGRGDPMHYQIVNPSVIGSSQSSGRYSFESGLDPSHPFASEGGQLTAEDRDAFDNSVRNKIEKEKEDAKKQQQQTTAQTASDITPSQGVFPTEQQTMTGAPVPAATPVAPAPETPAQANVPQPVSNYKSGTSNAGYAEEIGMIDNKTGERLGNVSSGEAVGITKDNKVAVASQAKTIASEILPKMNTNMSNPNAQTLPQNAAQVQPPRSTAIKAPSTSLDPMRLTADNSYTSSPSFDRSMSRIVQSGNKYNSRGVPWSNV